MTAPGPGTGPGAAAALTPAEAERLAALVSAATTRQSTALDAAIDDGFRHIPRLLRGPVKAVLFR